MPDADYVRRYPYGAEVVPGGGVHFRIWAPICHRVEVVVEGGPATELRAEGGGWFSGPVEGFPGRFGGGYDGVCVYAPTRLYGTPDDMRRFVDAAHALGIGVLLDV